MSIAPFTYPDGYLFPGDERPSSIADVMSQVTALCLASNTVEISRAKRCYLRKLKGGDYGRPRIPDRSARMRKLGLETGFDTRTGQFLKVPLEPWTCDDHTGAMRLYGEILRAPDGTFRVSDFDAPDQLDHIRYIQSEKLIIVENDDTIAALGDAKSEPQRKYPGAPVNDRGAAVGRQLRGIARELIADRFAFLCRTRRDELGHGPGRIAFSARVVTEAVNKLKAQRRDLDEYRYLSVETCRRLLRKMIADGTLTELEPPRCIRADRTWITLPRVYEIPPGLEEVAEITPRSRRFGIRRRSLRRAA